jgi:hypothetical protein
LQSEDSHQLLHPARSADAAATTEASWLAAALLVAISTLSGFGAAELVLRFVLGPPVHFVYPQESYAFDPEIGHRLVPGDRAFTHAEPVEINSAGLRGPEYAASPPSGSRRILALGDSQTFGNGLPRDATWPYLLEVTLERTHPGVRFEVINGGVSGTDTWQHARLLERWAAQYRPDAVVLAFYVNDVVRRHEPQAPELTNSWKHRLAYAMKRSAVVSFGWSWARRITSSGEGAERELRLIRGDPDPELAASWAEVASSLAQMGRFCDESGIPFWIAVLPRRDQVSGVLRDTAFNRRVVDIASAAGIPAVDLLEPLQRAFSARGSALFIPWDGHNSRLANEVVARQLTGILGPRLANTSGAARSALNGGAHRYANRETLASAEVRPAPGAP